MTMLATMKKATDLLPSGVPAFLCLMIEICFACLKSNNLRLALV